jgi:hypothetical protein
LRGWRVREINGEFPERKMKNEGKGRGSGEIQLLETSLCKYLLDVLGVVDDVALEDVEGKTRCRG